MVYPLRAVRGFPARTIYDDGVGLKTGPKSGSANFNGCRSFLKSAQGRIFD